MNEQMNQKRIQKIDCDLVIRIADKEFPAHREVLAKRLRFFRKRISSEMLEENQTVINLEPKNVKPEVFEDVLQYIYISQIKFTTTNLEPIYQTADHLHFDDLLNEADQAMMNVDKTNSNMIVLLMNIAKDYNLWSIESECKQSIISNPLSEVGKEHLIPALTFAHLKVLLKRISDRKEDMFHLCVEWVESDQSNRSRRLPELLQLIPLNQLSTEFLNETVFSNAIVRNNSEALVLLIEALKSSKFKTSTNSDTPRPQTTNEFGKTSTSRTFENSNNFPDSKNHSFKSPASECLYVIGGRGEGILSSVSKLDSITNKWTASTPMPTPREEFGCAVIGRKIYVCGGQKGEEFITDMNELTVYDTVTEQWTELQPMKYARYECAMAALDGFLYVAGGRNNEEPLSVVERNSVENNEWETATPMNTERIGLELVSMNGFLYAIGGHDGSNSLSNVERYCPQTNEWETVASLKNRYAWFGSAVLNNRIYVAGGGYCEVYHPEEDKWHTMPAPTKSSSGIRLAVFNGKLLSVGGDDYRNGSKSVEQYDFEAKAWVPEADMDIARRDHGVAVVKNC